MSSENIIINPIDLKKEKRKEYDKNRIRPLYYEEKRAEKIFCICGCLIRLSNMRLHLNTTKHEETLKKQSNESILNIEKLNEKLKNEIKEKYDEKKEQEKIKKEKAKKEIEERLQKEKDKIAKRESAYMTVTCACGCQFQKRETKRHEKSIHHIEFLMTQTKI